MTEAVQRRTEAMGAWIAAASVVASAATHLDAVLPLLLATASASSFAGGALAWERPAARRALFAGGSGLWLAAISVAAHLFEGPNLAPSLVLLPLAGTLATLLSGWRVGAAAFAVANVGLWAHFLSHPSEAPVEIARRANLAGGLLWIPWFIFHHEKTFRALLARMGERKRSIEQRLAERDGLTRDVARDLVATVEALGARLADARPELGDLQRARSAIEAVLASARAALGPRGVAATAAEDDELVPAFMLRMARWLIAISAIAALVTALRVAVLGRGAQAENLTALVADVALLYLLSRFPRARGRVVAAHTVVLVGAVASSLSYWGYAEIGPGLMFLPTLAYNAVQIGGARTGFALVLVQLAVYASAGLAGAGSDPWARLVLVGLGISAAGLQMGWYLIEMRVQWSAHTLHARNEELKRLEAFRARLSGTLFHDVANPLAAIAMVLHVAKIRSELRDEDVELLRRFQARLESLLSAALGALESDGPIPADRVRSMRVGEMFGEVAELFSFKLAEKGQSLRIEAPPDLRVVAVPELLRDSIVANLVSNAIKFSPLGATIVLHAERRGDDVELVVRDQGPGWPDDLVRQIAEGERPESMIGTGGERGLGLGLGLVVEHTRRMGGRLDLRRTRSSGSEAAITLLSA